jgi:hypothetical protein
MKKHVLAGLLGLGWLVFSSAPLMAGCGGSLSGGACPTSPIPAAVVQTACPDCAPVVLKRACPNCCAGCGPMLNGCADCNDFTSPKVGPISFDPWIWRW